MGPRECGYLDGRDPPPARSRPRLGQVPARVQFSELGKEPFIAELVGNPMQLTILLDLLHQHGAATAAQRTELYDQYVELLLAREANK